MPIGLVDDSLFEAELEKLQAPAKKESHQEESHPEVLPAEIEEKHVGRSNGDTNVPESLRKLIGEEAAINGRASALRLAEAFGVSPSSVSAYAAGATSTATINTPKPGILEHINKSRARAIKRASTTLNQALGSITQDKLDYSDAKDLAGIAKDMSVIIKNLEPPAAPATPQNLPVAPQFVIFAPSFKKEEHYEVIDMQREE